MKRSRRENPAAPPPTPPGGRQGQVQGQSHAAGGAGGGFELPMSRKDVLGRSDGYKKVSKKWVGEVKAEVKDTEVRRGPQANL